MNIERAKSIEGWMSDQELTYLAEVASKSNMIVEIGSWMGRSTSAIAANTSGTVYAVDTWKGTHEQGGALDGKDDDWLINQFIQNTRGLDNIRIMQNTSIEAAHGFELQGRKFDMIFLDAAHDYDNVSTDIKAWLPLLTKNGVFCGHDYHGNWQGVKQAVEELIGRFRVVDTIWTTEGA